MSCTVVKGTLEKQVQELEDENEKQINEYSKMEKLVEKLKLENTELKQRVNEGLLNKEREESLRLENANLKNQLGLVGLKIKALIFSLNLTFVCYRRLNLTSNQLLLENQQLMKTFNEKASLNEVKTASTQTSVQLIDDPMESELSKVRFHNLFYDDLFGHGSQSYSASKNYDVLSNNQRSVKRQTAFNSNGHVSSIDRSGLNPAEATRFMSRINKDDLVEKQSAVCNSEFADPMTNKYCLARTDEHLISNFRPFTGPANSHW